MLAIQQMQFGAKKSSEMSRMVKHKPKKTPRINLEFSSSETEI